MSASQMLTDIEAYQLNVDYPITPQIEEMGSSCRQVLNDCGLVVDDALQAAFREVTNHILLHQLLLVLKLYEYSRRSDYFFVSTVTYGTCAYCTA